MNDAGSICPIYGQVRSFNCRIGDHAMNPRNSKHLADALIADRHRVAAQDRKAYDVADEDMRPAFEDVVGALRRFVLTSGRLTRFGHRLAPHPDV